ncbi:MAG: SUMF1/EgtB/PvdO family nonheme iron enzyme [Anaerolineae bacterium]
MPRIAPRETVTFLFTDIQASTVLWQEHPDAMTRALLRHDAEVRAAIELAGGHVFKTVGDAFYAVFSDPCSAVEAAAAIQQRLSDVDWAQYGTGFPPIRVRIGVHTGAAEMRGGDYFGASLSRVARLTGAASGGQVLVSLTTQQIVREYMPSQLELRDLGDMQLRDLVHSERVFSLLAPGISERDASSRPPETASHVSKVVADEAAAATSLPEATRLLLEAVRGDGHRIALRPEQLREVADQKPADLTSFRLGRVAEWSLPRYRLDERFVELALLVDRGETVSETRWQDTGDRYEDLRQVLDVVEAQAIVVLGPPGSGKSTLLRRFELDAALSGLRGADTSDTVTFFVPLSRYAPDRPGAAPVPAEWLAERWRLRYPELPPLDDLASRGRLVLLLDGLNELPTTNESEFHDAVRAWKDYLHRVIELSPSNRVVFSCRSLDYSAPLSSPQLRVPQVRVQPLGDEQVRMFLKAYGPLHYRETWAALEGSPQLELLRSPYFLKLLVQQVESEAFVPHGRVGLFTSFVRQALQREVERDNVLFRPDTLLTRRDVRQIVRRAWRTPYDLPDRGALVERISKLAFEMQEKRFEGEAAQVRIQYDDALDLVDHEKAEEILDAGLALSLLDEDTVTDELRFVHQLLQEYMAARTLAARPNEARDVARSPWCAGEVVPPLDELLATIAPADALPRLPTTGWEETALLAAAMTDDPAGFVDGVAESNLVLAARCAAQPDVRVPEPLADRLKTQLLARSRNPEADLRSRLAAGEALGQIGDPRLTPVTDGERPCLVPEMASFAPGRYCIGRADEAGDESPQHEVELASFELARTPVTNAEWRLFMVAGGYDDERWWDTAASRDWQLGVGTAHGLRAAARLWTDKFRAEPGLLKERYDAGQYSVELHRMWVQRTQMSDEELEEHLAAEYPSGRQTEPRLWTDPDFNGASQPVVGVCWFEARAYCNWLSAQTGRSFRLPTEAEWEAAARGCDGRVYAFGDEFDSSRANCRETHLRRTAPVGVFPLGDTPEGLADMTGNTWDWTTSLYGRRPDRAEFEYPYVANDGREDHGAGPDVHRVSRGGSWFSDAEAARATTRYTALPDVRLSSLGLRLAL